MKNPWKELIDKVDDNFTTPDKKYAINDDLKVIEKFNQSFKSEKSKTDYEIHYDIHPSHYTGNIKNAEILILATNPGFVPKEVETLYKNKSFHKEMIENLDFKTKTFLNTDPKRIKQGDYWHQRTKKLREIVGDDNVYKKIALIQFFPYHSLKYKKIARKHFTNGEKYLKTQKFGFELIKEAIKKNKLIIISRSYKDWYEAIPELIDYKKTGNVIELKNYRQPYLTKGNMKDPKGFDKLVNRLKK